MRISIGALREAVAAASTDYMRKERIREAVQGIVEGMVRQGDIATQEELDDVFSALDMSLRALKMVPLHVWQQLGSPQKQKGRRRAA